MMTRFLLAGLLAVLALPGQVTVLTHAMLIDGSGGPPQPDATIVLANGKIRNIGPAPKVKIPALAKVVDLSGKRRCCMIQLRREWGRFSNFSFRTPQRRISAYPARPSG